MTFIPFPTPEGFLNRTSIKWEGRVEVNYGDTQLTQISPAGGKVRAAIKAPIEGKVSIIVRVQYSLVREKANMPVASVPEEVEHGEFLSGAMCRTAFRGVS